MFIDIVGALLAGAAVGGGLAWILARGHARARLLVDLQSRESRLAGAEATADELRKQLSQRDLDVADLRDALAAAQTQRAQAETRWEAARQNLEEQRRLLDDAQARLGETFKALSVDALRESNTAFLQLAQRTLAAELEPRQQAMDGIVRPLAEALRRYEDQVRQFERQGQQAYGSVEKQLELLASRSAELQRETNNLVTALRAPQVRGRWGEVTLHRVVELAGMTEHCDYLEQVTVDAEAGRLRPDMIVRLPNGREVIVDSKVPLIAYLDALSAPTEEERQAALARHGQQVRHHMNALSVKAYWEGFAKAPAFVVMFIPGESFVAAAAHADPALIEDGMAKGVVVATPTTLIALLHAIAFGWRQEQVAENAERLRKLGSELHDRIQKFAEHLERVGVALGRATGAFNDAVGSLEHRVLPSARRFRELGAAAGAEIDPMKTVDVQPRSLTAPELPGVEPVE
jgi:DNA recombination protein RmuC